MCDEDEELIRYHFEEMSPGERSAFDARLAAEPRLVARLAAFRRCVAANDGDETPDGLADRTASAVLEPTPAVAEASVSRCRFSLAESVVLGSILLLLLGIAAPAIQCSRHESRRVGCEQNLHLLGQALIAYANDHGGDFPRIDPQANAGMFTLALADGGYLDRDSLCNALVCPGSKLAEEVAADRATVRVPTRAELREAHARMLQRLQRFMAGSYAYRLGHYQGDVYVAIHNRQDTRAPLLADTPGEGCAAGSGNHGGCGQNVLFQDGRVHFQTDCWLPGVDDHLYLNKDGRVAAGHSWLDAVLARSEACPGVVRPVSSTRE